MMVDNQPESSGLRRSTLDSRLIIAGMLLLAVAAGIAAIWYLRGLSQRSMEFWGPASELILHAPLVEVYELSSTDEAHNISRARGLINVRRGLMNDASYDWSAQPKPADGNWRYALRFQDSKGGATILLSIDPPLAMKSDRTQCVSTRPIAKGLQAFVEEQFEK